ncbi:hypothetical protein DFJ43DRAFT_1164179 [Lentinula guzmanii]|uniref:Uncharacterized protein n=1 Tax=Lentinula guzmanii TaxID=2804957 RepID=A0AA38JZ54_9AGAR|nr:hypothetical protein DFJ43DRAFT_1164179 [Lentinula guzmanii]
MDLSFRLIVQNYRKVGSPKELEPSLTENLPWLTIDTSSYCLSDIHERNAAIDAHYDAITHYICNVGFRNIENVRMDPADAVQWTSVYLPSRSETKVKVLETASGQGLNPYDLLVQDPVEGHSHGRKLGSDLQHDRIMSSNWNSKRAYYFGSDRLSRNSRSRA